MDWGPSPFRFFNEWLEDKEMTEDARDGWESYKVYGSQGFKLFSKAKAMNFFVKKW